MPLSTREPVGHASSPAGEKRGWSHLQRTTAVRKQPSSRWRAEAILALTGARRPVAMKERDRLAARGVKKVDDCRMTLLADGRIGTVVLGPANFPFLNSPTSDETRLRCPVLTERDIRGLAPVSYTSLLTLLLFPLSLPSNIFPYRNHACHQAPLPRRPHWLPHPS